MTNAAVAVDFYHILDVELYFSAEVTLYSVVSLDLVTELSNLSLGKVLCTSVRIDSCLLKDRLSTGLSDAVDIGERDLNALLIWNINTSYTSPLCNPSFLWFVSRMTPSV